MPHIALRAKMIGEIYSACIKLANQLKLIEAYSEMNDRVKNDCEMKTVS